VTGTANAFSVGGTFQPGVTDFDLVGEQIGQFFTNVEFANGFSAVMVNLIELGPDGAVNEHLRLIVRK
jgi:hypothetical protein